MTSKNVNLRSGTIYFKTPYGEVPCPTESIEITTETPEIDPVGGVPRVVVPVTQSYTITATITDGVAEKFMEGLRNSFVMARWRSLCSLYENKRVVHLANHHPNARIRKKNIMRILENARREAKKGVKRK